MEEKSQYALVPRQSLTPDLWAMFNAIDQAAYSSRRFNVTQGETAIKLIFCLENQLPLSTANTGLYIVNGRLGIMGNVIAARLRQHPDYDYEIVSLTEHGCTIAIHRNSHLVGQASFTEEDAKRAGLLQKGGAWNAYPTDMYFNRAISRAYKLYAPDLFSGPVYVPDELGQNANAIEGEFTVAPTTQPEPIITLDSLLAQYSPEAIMAANGGRIPATDEEVRKVGEVLKNGNA